MKKKNLPWHFSALIFAAGLVLWFLSQHLIGELKPPECGIGDRIHEWTAPIDQFFLRHPQAADGILIFSSLWIDFYCLCMSLSIFGSSVHIFLRLALFLALRQIMQSLVSLPIPQGIIWHDPGFPSLFVDYKTSHDLYFSAHTGISLLGAEFLASFGKRWLTLLGIFIFLFTVSTVLIFRIHYTTDVYTAIMTVFFVTRIADKLSPPIDRALLHLRERKHATRD